MNQEQYINIIASQFTSCTKKSFQNIFHLKKRSIKLSSKEFFDIVYKSDEYYSKRIILKRDLSKRLILCPNKNLKILQKNLSEKLCMLYEKYYRSTRPSAHGFLKEKSIITNANQHKNKRYVLNFDLKNFFDTIHFGRVRGLLMKEPYNVPEYCATLLAKIICYKNKLPQGGATSPIISNMICTKLDYKFQLLAKKNKCRYTRYADDITFSTNLRKFPLAKGRGRDVSLSEEVVKIVEDNGFSINENKSILQKYNSTQRVTGLTVNKKVNISKKYIRHVRDALHIWSKYGLDKAAEIYFEKWEKRKSRYYFKNRNQKFKQVIRGKIQHIKNVRRDVEKTKQEEDISEKLYNTYEINCRINSAKNI